MRAKFTRVDNASAASGTIVLRAPLRVCLGARARTGPYQTFRVVASWDNIMRAMDCIRRRKS